MDGSRHQAQGIVDGVREQGKADSEAADREKRAAVYAAYLASANEYSVATANMFGRWKKQEAAAKGKPFTKDRSVLPRYYAARNRYQDQINQVYVYGSDSGWKAHETLEGILPNAIGQVEYKEVKYTEFIAAYQAFVRVFCKEAPAQPRPGCG